MSRFNYLQKLLQCLGLCLDIPEKTSNAISQSSLEQRTIVEEENLKGCSDPMTESLLPLDLILEILSRLPVKPLSRFKCVCKLWRSAIQDRHFIHKYKIHNGQENPTFQESATEDLILYHCSDGLVLEGSTMRDKLFLRNPATGQTVNLPDPHKGAIHIQFSYIWTSKMYKLVHVHVKVGRENGGCKVLSLGTDHEWRSIDIPSLHSLGSPGELLRSLIINEVFFLSRFTPADSGVPELIYLDLASESFGHIKAPPVIFKNAEKFSLVWWEYKLSLAYHDNEELHFWILEDFKKQKWAKKTITPFSSLLAKYPDLPATLSPHFVHKGVMHIHLSNRDHIEYCIASKEAIVTAAPPGKKVFSFGYVNVGRIPESEVVKSKFS